MTVAKPMARPLLGSLLLGSLLLAALAVYTAMSLSGAVAPHGASITLTHTAQTESRAKIGNGLGQAAPQPADAGNEPFAGGTPLDSFGRSLGDGTERFADAGPGIVGPAAPQAVQSCGPKRCPQPQR